MTDILEREITCWECGKVIAFMHSFHPIPSLTCPECQAKMMLTHKETK